MGDSSVEVMISAKYDNILSLHVKEFLKLPYSYTLDELITEQIIEQIGDDGYLEDNSIIKEYDIMPDKNYSLSKTKENLMENLYVCR